MHPPTGLTSGLGPTFGAGADRALSTAVCPQQLLGSWKGWFAGGSGGVM